MDVGRWDPIGNITALQERINRRFEEAFPSSDRNAEEATHWDWRPAVDIFQAGDEIVIVADLPGLTRDDVTLEVRENHLTIKGIRPASDDTQSENYYRRERGEGRFHRSFKLLHAVQPEKINAIFENGMLTIRISKPDETRHPATTVRLNW